MSAHDVTATLTGVDLQASQIVGRYQICERLASGGMATVYLARMEGPGGFGKLVAIKRIHPHLASEPRFVDMFLDEARLASQISHPNVCSVLDFGAIGDTYYLALEYIMGETLLSFLEEIQGRVEVLDTTRWHSFAAHVIAAASDGLHAAHELCDEHGKPLHVVHRDVSPDNVFVTFEGAVKVLDFGVARAKNQVHKTNSDTIKGKYGYMAPEVLYGDTELDRRVDIWALGVCMWEMLTAERLFRRGSDAATVSAIVHDPIPEPRDVRPDIPKPLNDIVMRALSRDRELRPATALEFARALRRFIAEHGELMDLPEVAKITRGIHADSHELKRTQRDRVRTTGSVPIQAPVSEQMFAFDDSQSVNPQGATQLMSTPPPTKSPLQTAQQTAQPQPAPSSRRRRAFWIGLPIVLAGVIGAVLALSGGDDEPRSQPEPARVAATDTDTETAAGVDTDTAAGVDTVAGVDPDTDDAVDTDDVAKTDTEPEVRETKPAPKRRVKRTPRASRTTSETPAKPTRPAKEQPTTTKPTTTKPAITKPTKPVIEPVAPPPVTKPPVTRPPPKKRPTSFDAKASISGLTAKGSLSRSQVQRAIKRAMGDYRACYKSAARAAGRNASVKVPVTFKIDENGWARSVKVTSTSLPNLSSCVHKVTRKIRSRYTPDVGSVKVSFAIAFKPIAN